MKLSLTLNFGYSCVHSEGSKSNLQSLLYHIKCRKLKAFCSLRSHSHIHTKHWVMSVSSSFITSSKCAKCHECVSSVYAMKHQRKKKQAVFLAAPYTALVLSPVQLCRVWRGDSCGWRFTPPLLKAPPRQLSSQPLHRIPGSRRKWGQHRRGDLVRLQTFPGGELRFPE